jgi:ubiquinone/menaquinone biosynthesis C-methylase UbiE
MAGFETVGWTYDVFMDVMERTGLGVWRVFLTRRARGRVLDLGCGTGRSLGLFTRAEAVVGVDPSLGMLVRARRRAPAAPLVVGRAEQLPFTDDAFDTVVSALVFCSVDQPRTALAEIRRVLAPDGSLRMLEHVRSTRPWAARLQDAAQPAWTWISGGCHLNRPTEHTVESAGFAIERVGRRARRSMRLFVARPATQPSTSIGGEAAGSDVA